MERRRKRTAAIGAVAALAVAGGGVAYAAATGGDHRDAFLRDAAGRLNVTPDRLRAALEGAADDQLDQAVRDGKLTQGQADRIKQQIRARGLPLGGPGGGLGGPGVPGPWHGPMGGPGGVGGPGPLGIGLDAAARYLGLSRDALARDLFSGSRTLAQVAQAQGKSVDGLQQALLSAARSGLDRAVSDRRLTSDQADRIYRDLQQHVGDLVNGRGPGPLGLRTHRDGPGMRGGPGGPPPWGAPPGAPGP